MDTRKVLSAFVIIAFLIGGYWYYLHGQRSVQPASDSQPTMTAGGVPGGQPFQFPTSTPHVNGPTSPPPSGTTATPKPIAPSGIRGSVSLGPTCPVQRIPPDPRCADRPYATKLVAKNANGAVAATFSSNNAGTFKVSLPAGTYSVGPAEQAYLPRASFQDVVVKAGAFTDITIQFDSGIR